MKQFKNEMEFYELMKADAKKVSGGKPARPRKTNPSRAQTLREITLATYDEPPEEPVAKRLHHDRHDI